MKREQVLRSARAVLILPAVVIAAQTAQFVLSFRQVATQAGVRHLHEKPVFDPKLGNVMPWIASFHAGAAVGDFDGDGFDDLYVLSSRPGAKNALFRNKQDFTFEDVATEWHVADLNVDGSVSTDAVFGDLDNDGRADLVVVAYGRPRVFHNAGGHFVDVSARAGVTAPGNASSVLLIDYNRDGLLDIFITHYFPEIDLFHPPSTRVLQDSFLRASNGGRPLLYRNNGDGTFTEVASQAGLTYRAWTLDAGSGDLDHDGYPDLYIANDFGTDLVFRGRPGGRFEDVTDSAKGGDTAGGMNVEFGDYDNDGALDIFVTNITTGPIRQGNMLWHNDGKGRLANVAKEAGVFDTGWGWCGRFLDLDNDGQLDLYTVSGFVSMGPSDLFEQPGPFFKFLEGGDLQDAARWPDVRGRSIAGFQRSRLFHNEGGQFREMARSARAAHVGDGRGIAVADFDHDGGLDFFVTNCGQHAMLYRNESARGTWLEIRLEGTRSNRDAIGARVRVKAGATWLLRQVDGGNGYSSQSSKTLHFGLGTSHQADEIEIEWPSGARQSLGATRVNQILKVREQAQ